MSKGLKTRKWSREGAGLAQGLRADLQLQKSGPMMQYQDTRSWHRACEPLSPPPSPCSRPEQSPPGLLHGDACHSLSPCLPSGTQ